MVCLWHLSPSFCARGRRAVVVFLDCAIRDTLSVMTEKSLKELGSGRFLRLVVDGGGWEFVQRVGCRDAAAVVATTEKGELILIEEMRPPIGAPVIALPAGLIGDGVGGSEDALVAAGRELEEETGYKAGELIHLHSGPVSPGLTDERSVLVRARNCVQVGPGGGIDGEQITVHVLPESEIASWLQRRITGGAEIDHKVYAGLYWLSCESRAPGSTRR